MMGSASAVFTDLNAWDANTVKHANKGEDFNISMTIAHTSDINADANYIIALNYNGLYVDLNVQVTNCENDDCGNAAGWLNDGGDANVESRSVGAAGTGPCAVAMDVNIVVFNRKLSDTNTFNITVRIPTTAQKGQIDHLVGRPVTVEMWQIDSSNQCRSEAEATARFVIGPAIIVRTPNESSDVAMVDQNITVMGFGFTPSSAMDENVTISFWDANGTQLNAALRPGDLNIFDTSHGYRGLYHKAEDDIDTNGAVMSIKGATGADDVLTWDWNGITVHPDSNGEFDVNITVPPMSGSVIGRTDLNTLRASSSKEGDVNAFGFVIIPKITTAIDVNATVTIDGHPYDLNTALTSRVFTDLERVGPTNDQTFTIRLGNVENMAAGEQIREVVIKFNSDVNLAKAAIRDYAADMNALMGRVRINTSTLTEFNIDANIVFYNVKVPSKQMPFISKDGIVCATSVCTNQDGTDLEEGKTDSATGVKTWVYNSDTGDGNLAFRASGISLFELTTLTVEVLTPSPGEKIRIPRHNSDANYAITFRFKDLNVTDNDITINGQSPMEATIYYSDYGGAKTGVIFRDTNLFDNSGIRCGNTANYSSEEFGYATGATITNDLNLAIWNTCQFDLNRNDLNIFGEFVVDVNIMAYGGAGFWGNRDKNRSVLAHTDGNVFFNPPLIEITDTNFSSANFVINNFVSGLDINYVIDFNIYLPDINTTQDQNLNLGDYNIHFYLSASQGGLTHDLNIMDVRPMLDQNFTLSGDRRWTEDGQAGNAGFRMTCTEPATGFEYLDYDCNAMFDVNNIWDKKYYLVVKIMNNKTQTLGIKDNRRDEITWTEHTIDVNELWDINSTEFAFTINDNNKPRCIGGTSSLAVDSSSFTFNTNCDDNSSGISNYYFKISGGDWQDNGTTNSRTFTVSGKGDILKTYSLGVKDYAGNISDMNVVRRVTHRLGGSSDPTPWVPVGSVGPSGPGTTTTEPGTETIVDTEQDPAAPTGEQVQNTLRNAGQGQAMIDAAKQIATQTQVGKAVKVEKTTSSTGAISYRTTVTVRVRNNSMKKWKDTKVVVEVPKALATRATDVSSDLEMKVLKNDPIIEFTIPTINAGQTYDMVYTVASSISETVANNMPAGFVTAYTETVPCEGVVCPDEDCRTGICNPGTELCEYANKEDGLSCGSGMECRAGACLAKAAPPAPPAPPEEPAPDYTTSIIVIIVVIILAAVGVVYYTKYYQKGKKILGK